MKSAGKAHRYFWGLMVVSGLLLGGTGCKKKPAAKAPAKAAGEEPSAAREPAAAPEPAEPTAPPPVARVGGQEISRADLDAEVERLDRGRAAPLTPQQRVNLQRRALEQLVERVLVRQAARQEGVDIAPDELDAVVARKVEGHGGPDAFARYLERTNLTRDAFREVVRADLLRDRLVEKLYATGISDEELRARYQKERASTSDEKFRMSRILIKVPEGAAEEAWAAAEKKLTALRGRIEGGLDFAEAARTQSQDGYARRGGDMGWVTRARRPTDVFAPGFGAPVGAVRGPVRVEKGVQIIQVTRREGVTGDFETEKEKVREALTLEKRTEGRRRLLEDLKARTRVEILL